MFWSFAIVNNKLAEIYFDRDKNGNQKITNHCYVKKEDYKTKHEQKMIETDIKRIKVVYRKGEYKVIKIRKGV